MAKFVLLTDIYTGSVFVNPEHVISLRLGRRAHYGRASTPVTVLRVAGLNEELCALEKIETVIAMLSKGES